MGPTADAVRSTIEVVGISLEASSEGEVPTSPDSAARAASSLSEDVSLSADARSAALALRSAIEAPGLSVGVSGEDEVPIGPDRAASSSRAALLLSADV
ncbi:hypothetical protein, partial [Actinomadura sp. KC216]|uniref:hypothetical protein n=1 Tax=Actinomadura sp. KC216 TaxID=2530370 RepID=UPI001A9D9284